MARPMVKGALVTTWAVAMAAMGCSETPLPELRYTPEQLNAASTGSSPELDSYGPSAAATPAPYVAPPAEPTTPPPAVASVRVIHASPDRAAASVDVYLDDIGTAGVSALAYKSISPALATPTGEHRVSLQRAGVASATPRVVSAQTPPLEGDAQYTAIAHGLTAGTPRLAVTVGRDDLTVPPAGTTRARFFHAITGLGAVDLCTAAIAARPAANGVAAAPARPATAVFENVAYGAFSSAYANVPAAGVVTLQVRARANAAARACAGVVRGTVSVTPPDQGVVTLVAVGRAVGAPAVARELLMCTDRVSEGAPRCAAIAIR